MYPAEMTRYIEEVEQLNFYQRPDYLGWRDLFRIMENGKH